MAPDDAANKSTPQNALLTLSLFTTLLRQTSGSNAGIGFAVPSDQIQPAVQSIIRTDKMKQRSNNNKQAWMGVVILKQTGSINFDDGNSTRQQQQYNKNWIVSVKKGSPAAEAGMRPLRIFEQDASVVYGDAIVAVGGNTVDTYTQVQAEIDRCIPGEQVPVTLQDKDGERRVVYLTLVVRP